MAAPNKCLALISKSRMGREATKKAEPATNPNPPTRPMKPTTKIRFTEPQIALVMRAYPNCNLDYLTELSFEFDQAGKVIDCIAQSGTAGISITIMPVAGSRALVRDGTPPINSSTHQRNDIAVSGWREAGHCRSSALSPHFSA